MDIWNIYEEKYLILFLRLPIIHLYTYVCIAIYIIADHFFVQDIFLFNAIVIAIYTVHFKKSFHMKSIKKLKK